MSGVVDKYVLAPHLCVFSVDVSAAVETPTVVGLMKGLSFQRRNTKKYGAQHI